MKQATHTPGPWEARSDRTVAAEGLPLLRCYAGRNEEANARLIAAAPELLAAGCNLCAVYDDCDADAMDSAIAAMHAVISKAKGK